MLGSPGPGWSQPPWVGRALLPTAVEYLAVFRVRVKAKSQKGCARRRGGWRNGKNLDTPEGGPYHPPRR